MDDRWRNITNTCHAQYSSDAAFFAQTLQFCKAWPQYSGRDQLRELLLTTLTDGAPPPIGTQVSQRCKDSDGEMIGDPAASTGFASELTQAERSELSEERLAAADAAMAAFEFNRNTGAGLYRGRLQQIYKRVAELLFPSCEPCKNYATVQLMACTQHSTCHEWWRGCVWCLPADCCSPNGVSCTVPASSPQRTSLFPARNCLLLLQGLRLCGRAARRQRRHDAADPRAP